MSSISAMMRCLQFHEIDELVLQPFARPCPCRSAIVAVDRTFPLTTMYDGAGRPLDDNSLPSPDYERFLKI